LRGLGRQLGVSLATVQRGIAHGRLGKSLGHDAKGVFVSDPKLAAREWAAGAAKPPNGGNGRARGPRPKGTLVDAQIRVANGRARALDLANRVKQGGLLDAGAVQREQFESARTIRDAVLGVPDRIAAELAGEGDPRRVHERLLAELRGALVAAAEILGRG
jgi:hypothetical protein